MKLSKDSSITPMLSSQFIQHRERNLELIILLKWFMIAGINPTYLVQKKMEVLDRNNTSHTDAGRESLHPQVNHRTIILMTINHRPFNRKGGLHTWRISSVISVILKGCCNLQVMTSITTGFMMQEEPCWPIDFRQQPIGYLIRLSHCINRQDNKEM